MSAREDRDLAAIELALRARSAAVGDRMAALTTARARRRTAVRQARRRWHHGGGEPAIHGFLRSAYWSAGVPRAVVERSIRHSIPFGLYVGGDPGPPPEQTRRELHNYFTG